MARVVKTKKDSKEEKRREEKVGFTERKMGDWTDWTNPKQKREKREERREFLQQQLYKKTKKKRSVVCSGTHLHRVAADENESRQAGTENSPERQNRQHQQPADRLQNTASA